ncbi:MAG: hypothetical protein ACREM1_25165 [Longimicrobiales bacterium]
MTAPRRAGRLTIAVTVLGSSAIAPGAALLPVNLLMLVVSPEPADCPTDGAPAGR